MVETLVLYIGSARRSTLFAMSCGHYAMAVQIACRARERCRSHGRGALRYTDLDQPSPRIFLEAPADQARSDTRACFMMRRGDSNCDSGRPLQRCAGGQCQVRIWLRMFVVPSLVI